MSMMLGGKVEKAPAREYGQFKIELGDSILFNGIKSKRECLMSHTDKIVSLPEHFKVTANTDNCAIAAFENTENTEAP